MADVNKESSYLSLNPWRGYLAFRNARLVTVEPVIFLYFFGVFLYPSLIQQYVFNRYGLDELKNTSFNETTPICLNSSEIDDYTGINGSYKVVERQSTNLFTYSILINTFTSIASSMIMGPLSDIYGRRPFIILIASGAILQGVCASLVVHFNLNVLFLILASGISGLSGDFTGMIMATFSYISDVSSSKWRTMRIGWGEAMLYLGGSVSQGLGGLWFQKLNCGLEYPLILFIACNFAIIPYTIFLLPESLSKDDRVRKRMGRPKGMRALARGAMIFLFQVKEYSVWILWVTLLSVMMIALNSTGLTTVQIIFFKVRDWDPLMIGDYQSISQASHIAALVFILPILVAIKLPDSLIALIGVVVTYGTTLFMGLSKINFEFFIIAALGGMGAVVIPILRGIMSKLVFTEDQGALFSIVSSVETLAVLLAGVTVPSVLSHTKNPETVFFILTSLGVIPTILISILLVDWCVKTLKRYGGNDGSLSEKTPIFQHNKKAEKSVNSNS